MKYFDKEGNLFAASYDELNVLFARDTKPIEYKSGESKRTCIRKLNKAMDEFCDKNNLDKSQFLISDKEMKKLKY